MLHPVLQIPELLSLIFSYSDHRTNATCATICKSWLDPALNELWRCVDDPVVLLSLLAPMHVANVGSDGVPRWLFSRFVLPSDWQRFQFYAHRVRYLRHHEPHKEKWIDASVYAEVARTRPILILLPKLYHFAWHTKLLNQAILFMHANITHLVARIDEPFLAAEGFLEARTFLVEAAARLPNLVFLDIRASFSVIHVQVALLGLFSCATRLRKVILPRYWLCSSVVSALADSPCLEVLQWEYVNQGEGDPKDLSTFKVVACDGAFPALLDLSLEVNLQDAAELIESPFFPDRMTTFYLQSLQLTLPADINRFLTSCSTNCRKITQLYLDLHANTLGASTDRQRITLETLEPVLSCPNITHFMLTYNEPLSITDNDVYLLASRWPSLTALHLNSQPVALLPPGLTLAALLPFAEHCPNLEEIGLYVDSTAPPPSFPNTRLITRLHELRFGTSPIEDAKVVALFLSRICPFSHPSACAPAITISAGVSWDPALKALIDPVAAREIEERRSRWRSVQTYLPMLLTLRSEERSRARQLEQELVLLRSGNEAKGVHSYNGVGMSRQRAMRDES